MFHSGRRNHLPLIRTMTLLVALLALIGWGLSSLGQGLKGGGLDNSRWQWAPASSFGEAAPPSGGWIPFGSEPNLQHKSRYYWLRISLPHTARRDPQLWIFNIVSIRVFDPVRQLFIYDTGRRGDRINLLTDWKLAPLPSPLPLEVFLLSDNEGVQLPVPWLQSVGRGDLYVELLRKDSFSLVLSALFLFTTFIALGLYTARRHRLYLYFALLSFCGCYGSMARNYLVQIYWDQPWFSYMDTAMFPLGVYAFVNIMKEVLPAEDSGNLRRLGRVILGFSALTLISAVFLDKAWYGWLVSYPLLVVFLITAGVVFWAIRRAYREHQGTDAIWMLSGFVIVGATALIHVLRTYQPMVFDRLVRWIPQLDALPFDLLSIGLFLFLICLIRVIFYRFAVMNRRLQHFGASLEQNVRSRTAELQIRTSQLQMTHDRLAESARETAETIASSMVLEERHRITGNIHDTVGHALTATIVQLEAAKRLLDRDPRLAMDKLTASQGLIRRGLEEIRQSVRLLKDDFNHYDLTDALLGLIRETEESTGAAFHVDAEPLPESLTSLQKRVLFQSLQEGITNGLRHGGSTRFVFSLRVKDPVLVFRLESDGVTYTPSDFGFGLKAMSERVSQLGGVLSVEPGHPGCVLLLSLPFSSDVQPQIAAGRET